MLLLVHLKVPIKNLKDLPLPYKPTDEDDPVRSHFNISGKYFMGEDVPSAVKKMLNHWFFRDEVEDPSLPEHGDNSHHKKFAFLDFQLNKQLKRLDGGVMLKPRQKMMNARSQFPVK